jgi:hypothetical protein
MSYKSVKSGNPKESVKQTSYEIVTKGHGGELKVESKAGVSTEFTVLLPRE